MDLPPDNKGVSSVLGASLELMAASTKVPYKEVPGDALHLHIFPPTGETENSPRSAIVFFYSSLWDQGAVSQFAAFCTYFATRGMTAIVAEYRTQSTHGEFSVNPIHAMEDARSAIRYIRYNSEQLGIEPDRIVAGGGAGGATLVAWSAILQGKSGVAYDAPDEHSSISSSPNAMVLLSPVLDISAKSGVGSDKFPDSKVLKDINPLSNVKKALPPSIIFVGLEDRVVPVKGTQLFVRNMNRKKNDCELVEFPGAGNGFYNCNVHIDNYQRVTTAIDYFLADRGFLHPSEEIFV